MTMSVPGGIYPTMITPFTDGNELDLERVDALMDYYAECGCSGVFALCQSSEIFYLSEVEKRRLMKRVKAANRGRMALVASAHTADDPAAQARQLGMVLEEGADAAVIILNRLAREDESECKVKRAFEELFRALSGAPLGVYECPYPYKRVCSPDLVKWMADSGRVVFVKDTCCLTASMKEKKLAAAGSPLKLFNANAATLSESLDLGFDGYSGVMANFHADLYVKLLALRNTDRARADELQAFLTIASLIESQLYPAIGKYYRKISGMDMSVMTRSRDISQWNATRETEARALLAAERVVRRTLNL